MGTKRTGIKKSNIPDELVLTYLRFHQDKDIKELANITGWTQKAVKEYIEKVKAEVPTEPIESPESAIVETPPNPAAPIVRNTKSALPEAQQNKTVLLDAATSEAADALPRGGQVINDPTRVHVRKK